MSKAAFYKNRAKDIGERFLHIAINVVMVALLIAAILFVLWLNLFATSNPVTANVPKADIPAAEPPSVNTEPAEAPAKATSEPAPGEPAKVQPPIAPAVQPSTEHRTTAPSAAAAGFGLGKLIVPVAGIKVDQLSDTYNSARSEGRTHNAIDIMAAQGTPVMAAANGLIRRLMYSDRGGNTIYQLSDDGKMVYYYAHLLRYADGVGEGKTVKQGEVIGYVGDTGNAGAGNYHLHFAAWIISDAKNFWRGENLNPYALLRR